MYAKRIRCYTIRTHARSRPCERQRVYMKGADVKTICVVCWLCRFNYFSFPPFLGVFFFIRVVTLSLSSYPKVSRSSPFNHRRSNPSSRKNQINEVRLISDDVAFVFVYANPSIQFLFRSLPERLARWQASVRRLGTFFPYLQF